MYSQSKKVVAIVQARMGSERLPQKSLKPILGKPMIAYTLEAMRQAKYVDDVVLATTDSKKDDELYQWAVQAGYQVYRGSEEDVLDRYYQAAVQYQAGIVVRVTGDCPLMDPVVVDAMITTFLSGSWEYISNDVPDTVLRGLDVEVFEIETLKRAYEDTFGTSVKSLREHVTPYIYQHPELFGTHIVKGEGFLCRSYRLCVDTEEDFNLVSKIIETLQPYKADFKKVVNLLDSNPELATLNSSIIQKVL